MKSPKELDLDPNYKNLEAGSPEAIFVEAFQKAEEAWTLSLMRHGEPMYCGFAWVEIKPARGPFIKFCKAKGIGDKGHNGGWHIWNPCTYHGQSMDLKEAAAYAFAKVLCDNGLNAYANSRAD